MRKSVRFTENELNEIIREYVVDNNLIDGASKEDMRVVFALENAYANTIIKNVDVHADQKLPGE